MGLKYANPLQVAKQSGRTTEEVYKAHEAGKASQVSQTQNPKPGTRSPEPGTRNLEPESRMILF